MATTDNLTITLITEGQRQKETAMNEALNVIDAAIGKVFYGALTGSPRVLPTATAASGQLAIATDVAGSQTWLVYSDGSVWRKIIQVDGTSLGA